MMSRSVEDIRKTALQDLDAAVAEMLSESEYAALMAFLAERTRSDAQRADYYLAVVFTTRRVWLQDTPARQMREAGRQFCSAAMALADAWDNDLVADPADSQGNPLLTMSFDEWASELWDRIDQATEQQS